MDAPLALRLLAGLAVGLVVGVERERRKQDPDHWAPAGIRTFALVSLLGSISANLGMAVVVLGGVMVTVLAGLPQLSASLRARASKQRPKGDDPADERSPERFGATLTTDVALVVVYVLGAFAQREPILAIGSALVVSLLLATREKVHEAVTRPVSSAELTDALILGVAAIVVLPLVPNRPVDPWEVVNPYALAKLAVTMMAVTFGGYVAARWVGPRYGLFIAGFFSGFVSSSATIGAMGSRAKDDGNVLPGAVAGAAASTVATFIQMGILVGLADVTILRRIVVPLVAGGAMAAVFAAFVARKAVEGEAKEIERGRAFSLRAAVVFAALVGVVIVVATLLRRALGEGGAILGAALAAFADTHAAGASLASMHANGQLSEEPAVLGILVGISTNSVTKLLIAHGSGVKAYARRVSVGVLLALAATWTAYAVARVVG